MTREKNNAGARKGRKVAKHSVFLVIDGSGGLTSRLAKAVGAEPSGQMRDEELHAVVAGNTLRSRDVQIIAGAEHYWKWRCRKSTRHCGAKHVFQVKMHKAHQLQSTLGSGDVEMYEQVHAVVARRCAKHISKSKCTSASDHFWKLRC